VSDGRIVAIGNVPSDDFHPESCNVRRPDGSIEVWPMTDAGDEKKWRYSKDSISSILEKLEPKQGRNSLQIIFNKDSGTMRSVWQAAKYDSSEYGTKLVEGMIGEAGFTFPKSLWAVRDALRIMTDDDPAAIVLDFFAGSGTTGHALWEISKSLVVSAAISLSSFPNRSTLITRTRRSPPISATNSENPAPSPS
jgi:adenine-specific DNA-methyltransferase